MRPTRLMIYPPLVALILLLRIPCALARDGGSGPETGKPAAGASGEAQNGESAVVVEVEGWWAAPRNLDLDYAFIDHTGSLSGGGEIVTLSPARRGDLRLRAGWKAGAEGAPTLSASFWEFDGSVSSGTGMHLAMVGARLASPDFAIGRSLVDSASADMRLRGTLVDTCLSWERDAGARTEIGFTVGLRLFRFEHETSTVYGADRSGVVLREFVRSSIDAGGLGPLGAFSFGYRPHRRVLVGGEIGVALPVGKIEAEASDSAFQDGTLDRSTVAQRPGTRRSFPHYDGAIRVAVTIARRCVATAAYRYSQWTKVALADRFADDVSQNTALPVEQDVIFEGLAAGVRCEF